MEIVVLKQYSFMKCGTLQWITLIVLVTGRSSWSFIRQIVDCKHILSSRESTT